MKQTFNKTQLRKALVEERKAMRLKHSRSKFMSRTNSIYKGMQHRAKEERGLHQLPFTLEEFRAWCEQELQFGCCYCGDKLTVANMTPDHKEAIARGGSFNLANLDLCCRPCNFRKGVMRDTHFAKLTAWVRENLDTVEAADLWRRLTIGGKWSFGK